MVIEHSVVLARIVAGVMDGKLMTHERVHESSIHPPPVMSHRYPWFF